MIRRPPRSPLFPSTPLSRSWGEPRGPRRPPFRAERRQVEQRPRPERRDRRRRVDRPRCEEAGERLGERTERSEEHTSELQSQSNLVCRLLLEKKKKTRIQASARAIPSRDMRHLPAATVFTSRLQPPLPRTPRPRRSASVLRPVCPGRLAGTHL